MSARSRLRRLLLPFRQSYYGLLDKARLNTLDRFDGHYFTQRESGGWLKDSALLVEELARRYQPGSVVDFGCGNGVYLKLFHDLGVARLQGFEGAATAVSNAVGPWIRQADLRQPIALAEKYDLALCIEVAPYLHPKHETVLLSSLANALAPGGHLVFSASERQAGGPFHVNRKSHADWIVLLQSCGMEYLDADSSAFRDLAKKFSTLTWLRDNLMVFRVGPQTSGH